MAQGTAGSATENPWVVATAAVVMQIGLGAVYAWSVFREPLSKLYGSGITQVNVAFFITILSIGFAAFGAGYWMRRVGPRVVGLTGGVLYGLGVFLASFSGGSLPVLYLTYGLIAGIGLGMAYIVPIQTLPKWFPDRPGLATGLAVVGFGAGSGITVPIAQVLMSSTGGPLPTFGILGIVYLFLVAGAALFVKDPPEGYLSPEQESAEQDESRSFREALSTWQWYAMWAMLLLNTTAGLAIISDAKAMAGELAGATTTLALAFVMIMAVGNATGRLFWAALSDRIGPSKVFLTMFLAQAVLFALLPILGAGAFVVFTILSFVVLSCYGGGFGTMPAFVGAYYGKRYVGTIYGGMLTAWGIASLGAPLLLALSTDATGSYNLALYITAGIMLLSSAIPVVIRPPATSKEASGEEATA